MKNFIVMNKKNIAFALSAMILAAVLTGCAKEGTDVNTQPGSLSDLELAMVNSTQTRAAIDGVVFPQDGHIGLFLFRDDAAEVQYGEDGYANVDYSYNSDRNKWTANPSMKVGSTEGYLYGYYPYSADVADIKAIPVMSSLNGDDVMYASRQQSPVTDENASKTVISMNHALARVSITVKNNGYSGQARLSSIRFSGAATSVCGTLDATDGSLSGTTRADVILDVPEADRQITAKGSVYECLLVPSAEIHGKQSVFITFTIDGQEKTAEFSSDNGVVIAQGTKSTIGITLSNSGISVQGVSIQDWNVLEVLGHKVSVRYAEDAGIRKDVMLAAYVEKNSVKIRAVSDTHKALECVLGADQVCSASKSGSVYTFTVSDITSDLTLTVQYVRPHGVSVSPDVVELSRGYGRKILQATVAPEDALDKRVVWSTSDPDVATVDENGIVYAHGMGQATITVTTVVGGHTAGCAVTVKEAAPIPDGALPGYFYVGDDKVVLFSRGNLYCKAGASPEDDMWDFESRQYEYHKYDAVTNEWGLFCWSTPDSNFGMSVVGGWYDFPGDFRDWGIAYCTAKHIPDTNMWYTLSRDECQYLIDHHRIKPATVCGVAGCVIAPEYFSGTIEDSYADSASWEIAESAGLLFLPYAGCRFDTNVSEETVRGFYYTSTPYGKSTGFYITVADVAAMRWTLDRSYGMSVRLVTNAK